MNINTCQNRIKINNIDEKNAIYSDYKDFFYHMAENKYIEKIAKNNYYIFDIVNDFLYYGKISSGFYNNKITEIYKTNIDTLKMKIPNYKKLNGFILKDIVLSEILKKNKLNNQNNIKINNIFYKLENNILVVISYMIQNKNIKEEYILSCIDFKIIP